MNWEAIGAIAELLGAIGVIVSLVSLATQIRASTQAMRSESRRAVRDASRSANLLIAAGFAGVVLLLSVALGKSARTNPVKDSPYECGMLPIGERQPLAPRAEVRAAGVELETADRAAAAVARQPGALVRHHVQADGRRNRHFCGSGAGQGIERPFAQNPAKGLSSQAICC